MIVLPCVFIVESALCFELGVRVSLFQFSRQTKSDFRQSGWRDTRVKPEGKGEDISPEIVNAVRRVDGGIGCMDFSYAAELRLPAVQVRNSAASKM